ncbi:MAG: HAD family hydrolase [Rhodospirillaceae bacterium]|jgi:HAD superfamily hydrolase (TIGR01509 family)|nr:HAD family hydrolase [Rhodospirillaceae bacterium]MBT5666184.1 HAD family hydrolase [Rhodospirillaceae bacterium]
MKNRLTIFDCDGVLVDSETLSSAIYAEALCEFGYAIDAETVAARFTGFSMKSTIATVEADWGQPLPEDFAATVRARADVRFDQDLTAISGIAAALDKLGDPRCVASSGQMRRIQRSLNKTDLMKYFDAAALFSAQMVDRGKPAPDLFLHAAHEMGFAPQSCVVIEDSLPGVQGAAAAGMTVLGFAGGSHIGDGHEDRMRRAGAHDVFDDMADLPGLLARL